MPIVNFSYRVKDLGLLLILKRAAELTKGVHVKVGIVGAEASTPAADEDGKSSLTLGELATVHEFGTEDGRVPERSFLRSTMTREREKYLDIIRRLAVDIVIAGKMGEREAFSILGERVVRDVRKTITTGIYPELADSTIDSKGRKGYSFLPLMATGQLLRGIDYEVKGGRGEGAGE